MQKLLAIALLALLSLPLLPLQSLLRAQSEAGLPACCRRDGKHHCMMQAAERQQYEGRDRQFQAPVEKCPYCPATITSLHSDTFVAPTAHAVFAELISHPASVAQTESKLRISRNRSRQKRGPPFFFSL